MKSIGLIASLLVCAICNAFSYSNTFNEYSHNYKTAQQLIFNLEFDSAEEILASELHSNPDNLLPLRLLSYIDFLKSFITEEDHYHEQLKTNSKNRLDKLKETDVETPFNKMIQGEILLHLSISEFKAKEFFSAAWNIRKAYKLLHQNQAAYPDFKENNLGLGMLHAIIGATPERYKWIMNMAGMKGELATGMEELEQIFQYCITNNLNEKAIEVDVIRLLTELHINKDFAHANNIAYTLNQHQNKTLVLFALTHFYMNTGNNEKAYNLLQKNNFSNNRFPFLFLYYMKGVAALNQLILNDSAYDDMEKFVTGFKGENFIKVAYQKMAWYKFITGDTAAYNELIQKCLTQGEAFTDEDKQAEVEANRNKIPNLYLLKARILFDGGLFDESRSTLELISENKFNDSKSKTEYFYRLGRAVDAINDDEKTIFYYSQTIKESKDKPWYYAANSALHLGIFYEEKQDYELAKQYYSECMNMNNVEYRTSIRQKAKTGLNRIKHK